MRIRLIARLFLVVGLFLMLWVVYQEHISFLKACCLLTALVGSCGLLERCFTRMSIEQFKQLACALITTSLSCILLISLSHYLGYLFSFAIPMFIDLMLLIFCGFLCLVLFEQLVRHGKKLQVSTRLLLITPSALHDPRLHDLAALGILDHLLCIPAFLIHSEKNPYDPRNQELVKKLQALPDLQLKIVNVSVLATDESTQLIEAAESLGAHLLTADLLLADLAQARHIKLISLQALATALKPVIPQGEAIRVKIQRLGKEADQGIGYLEDGTMVVVNGGGGYLGECVFSHVLSVRQTATGRMMFCNVCETT